MGGHVASPEDIDNLCTDAILRADGKHRDLVFKFRRNMQNTQPICAK